MSALSAQEEAKLKSLLKGRAEHLDVPQPYPSVDRSDRPRITREDHRRRVIIPSLVAAVLLIGFGLYRLGANTSEGEITDPATRSESALEGDGDLLVFVFPAERTEQVYQSIETLGSQPSSATMRRGVTDQEFTTYWADYPAVIDDFEISGGRFPISVRVKVDGGADREQLITDIGNIEGVVRIESYPDCGRQDHLMNPDCATTGTRIRGALVALVLGAAVLALLVKFGYIRFRLMASILLIALPVALTEVAIRPVKSELARAKPAVEEIRTQYGSDLTCGDWYDLEATSRAGVPSNYEPRFDAVDPRLVQEALEDGIDIYLWPIWVVPSGLFIVVTLGVAIALATGRSRRLVGIAVTLAIISCLTALPVDFKTNSAIQCMAE